MLNNDNCSTSEVQDNIILNVTRCLRYKKPSLFDVKVDISSSDKFTVCFLVLPLRKIFIRYNASKDLYDVKVCLYGKEALKTNVIEEQDVKVYLLGKYFDKNFVKEYLKNVSNNNT